MHEPPIVLAASPDIAHLDPQAHTSPGICTCVQYLQAQYGRAEKEKTGEPVSSCNAGWQVQRCGTPKLQTLPSPNSRSVLPRSRVATRTAHMQTPRTQTMPCAHAAIYMKYFSSSDPDICRATTETFLALGQRLMYSTRKYTVLSPARDLLFAKVKSPKGQPSTKFKLEATWRARCRKPQ